MTTMIRESMITWAISATLILLIVMMLRHVFGEKVSRRLRYSLWLVVMIRLLLPFSVGNSTLSIQNCLPVHEDSSFTQTIEQEQKVPENNLIYKPEQVPGDTETLIQQGMQQGMQQGTLSGMQQGATKPSLGDPSYVPLQGEAGESQSPVGSDVQPVTDEKNTYVTIVDLLLQCWCLGALAGVLWVLVVNIRFWLHLKKNRHQIREYQGLRVYETTELISPCLFGLWYPAIYLTPQVAADDDVCYYAMLHENCHRVHRDHVWGVLRGICLAIWWWHPLVWWAAAQSRQDCELACDEACVNLLGEEHRQEYGMALIRSLQALSQKTGNPYPGAAATLFSGKEELKVRLQALVKRPLVRNSAIMIVILTIALGVMVTFTGQSSADENLVDEPSRNEEGTEEVPETESQTAAMDHENVPLNGKVDIYTYTYPWTEQYVVQRTEDGLDVRKEALPVFRDDCVYHINNIDMRHHGIHYQQVEKTRFMETIAAMLAKKFALELQLIYQNDEIAEIYLKSDQQIVSLMDDMSLTDPEWPQIYDTWGLESYKTQKTYQADIADVAGVETIEIAAMPYDNQPKAVMIVRSESGQLLHAWDIHITQDQLEEILLVENDGVSSLLWWKHILGPAGEGYLYWNIRLDQQGLPILQEGARYSFRYALNQPGHVYDPSQLQMLVQPLYQKYFQRASLLVGVDGSKTLELYYTFRGLEAYHHTTLQAGAAARQEAYWKEWPASRYVYPDFEEWARIIKYVEEENRVVLTQSLSEYTAAVHPDCHHYVRFDVDKYTYEEVTATEFIEYLQGVRNTPIQLRYEGGLIVEMRLNSIYEGFSYVESLEESADGCLYREIWDAEQTYDWSEYTLKAEYTANVSDQEGLETIRIYEGMLQIQPTEPAVVLVVETADGKRIYLDQLDTFGHNTTSYYLGEKDGEAYLVYLYEEDRYTNGFFQYLVIRPGSQTNLLSGCGLDWIMEWAEVGHTFSEKSFLKWGHMADNYLNGSKGILRIESQDPVEDFEYSWEYDLDWQKYANEIQGREPGSM